MPLAGTPQLITARRKWQGKVAAEKVYWSGLAAIITSAGLCSAGCGVWGVVGPSHRRRRSRRSRRWSRQVARLARPEDKVLGRGGGAQRAVEGRGEGATGQGRQCVWRSWAGEGGHVDQSKALLGQSAAPRLHNRLAVMEGRTDAECLGGLLEEVGQRRRGLPWGNGLDQRRPKSGALLRHKLPALAAPARPLHQQPPLAALSGSQRHSSPVSGRPSSPPAQRSPRWRSAAAGRRPRPPDKCWRGRRRPAARPPSPTLESPAAAAKRARRVEGKARGGREI